MHEWCHDLIHSSWLQVLSGFSLHDSEIAFGSCQWSSSAVPVQYHLLYSSIKSNASDIEIDESDWNLASCCFKIAGFKVNRHSLIRSVSKQLNKVGLKWTVAYLQYFRPKLFNFFINYNFSIVSSCGIGSFQTLLPMKDPCPIPRRRNNQTTTTNHGNWFRQRVEYPSA